MRLKNPDEYPPIEGTSRAPVGPALFFPGPAHMFPAMISKSVGPQRRPIHWQLLCLLLPFAVSATAASPASGQTHHPLSHPAAYRLDLSFSSFAPDPYSAIALPGWDDIVALSEDGKISGIPIRRRLGPVAHFRAPYDIARQGRVPLAFCPGYWPEHEPHRTVGDFCSRDYYTYWPLFQGLDENPFRIARREVTELNENEAAAKRRAAWALAHWLVNGRDINAAATAVTAALASEDRVRADTLMELQLDQALHLLPRSVWEVVPQDDSCPVDLRVCSSVSHDSTVSMAQLLRLGGERGLKGIVVADRGHIAGAQEAQDILARLKDRGELPPDFEVIAGEHITCAGGATLTAIGVNSRILEGMTLDRTVEEIHRQGGVAIMNHPGGLGGPPLVRRMDVDGYFIQPRLFELFRTMTLLHDPALADKPPLYGSQARYSRMVGLPYSQIIGGACGGPEVTESIAAGQAYAASNLYFPLMAFVLIKPISHYEQALNGYFVSHEWLTEQVREILEADHVILKTTWDRSIQDLMSLDAPAWEQIEELTEGTSPLLDGPEIVSLAAQWGGIQIEYTWDQDEVWLTSRLQF